ncbi:hypothetical protein J4467_01055 [Candidatus Woesearchaeota archaeon]|nr:hypothetical protein [Candidatus Woesearchaeota archaeon]
MIKKILIGTIILGILILGGCSTTGGTIKVPEKTIHYTSISKVCEECDSYEQCQNVCGGYCHSDGYEDGIAISSKVDSKFFGLSKTITCECQCYWYS